MSIPGTQERACLRWEPVELRNGDRTIRYGITLNLTRCSPEPDTCSVVLSYRSPSVDIFDEAPLDGI